MLEIVREAGDEELVTADNSGVTDIGQGRGTHGPQGSGSPPILYWNSGGRGRMISSRSFMTT